MNKILLNIGIYFVYILVCTLVFFALTKVNDGGFVIYPIIMAVFLLGFQLIGTLVLSIAKFQDKDQFKEYIISFLFLLLIGLPGCFFNFLFQMKLAN